MHYRSTPPKVCTHQASAVLAVVIVLGAVSAMLAFSTAKATQSGLRATDSNRVTLQAQQYAASEAELLQHSAYDKLSSKEKSTISGSKYFSEIVVSGESAYGDSLKKKDCTVRVFYGSENLPRSTLMLSRFYAKDSSGSSGSWVDSFPASGTAPSDGIIVCTSLWNTDMSITISGKVRTEVNRRSKYGQGVTNATCPIAKGEPYSISGAGRICFFKL
jgi:hypothetical protein